MFEYETVTAGFEPRRLDDIHDRSEEFTVGGHFSTATRRTYLRDLTFSAEEYVALVGTMSAHRALEDDVREELFEGMRRRIEEGGGSATPTRLDVLYVARRA